MQSTRSRNGVSILCGLLGSLPGCGHHPPPHSAAVSEGTLPAADHASAASRPEEKPHLIEAKWKEVVVKAGVTAEKGNKEVAVSIKLVAPEIRLFHAAAETGQGTASKEVQKPPVEAIDLNQELRKITALDVDHIDVLDGQVAFIDTSRPERPELWMHELQVSAENLTTRLHLADGRPVLLTASGVLAHSGKVSIFITAEPFEKGLTFSGRAALVGLETSELYRFIEPATKLQAPEGTVDIFVEFDCRNGELNGGVKPLFKNVKVRPTKKNPFNVLKAWAADLAVKVFSDRAEQRNAVATVIPIKGTLTGANVELWPAIFGVLRNAFVEGLTAGYAHLPPPNVAVSGPPPAPVQTSGNPAAPPPKPPSAEPTP